MAECKFSSFVVSGRNFLLQAFDLKVSLGKYESHDPAFILTGNESIVDIIKIIFKSSAKDDIVNVLLDKLNKLIEAIKSTPIKMDAYLLQAYVEVFQEDRNKAKSRMEQLFKSFNPSRNVLNGCYFTNKSNKFVLDFSHEVLTHLGEEPFSDLLEIFSAQLFSFELRSEERSLQSDLYLHENFFGIVNDWLKQLLQKSKGHLNPSQQNTVRKILALAIGKNCLSTAQSDPIHFIVPNEVRREFIYTSVQSLAHLLNYEQRNYQQSEISKSQAGNNLTDISILPLFGQTVSDLLTTYFQTIIDFPNDRVKEKIFLLIECLNSLMKLESNNSRENFSLSAYIKFPAGPNQMLADDNRINNFDKVLRLWIEVGVYLIQGQEKKAADLIKEFFTPGFIEKANGSQTSYNVRWPIWEQSQPWDGPGLQKHLEDTVAIRLNSDGRAKMAITHIPNCNRFNLSACIDSIVQPYQAKLLEYWVQWWADVYQGYGISDNGAGTGAASSAAAPVTQNKERYKSINPYFWVALDKKMASNYVLVYLGNACKAKPGFCNFILEHIEEVQKLFSGFRVPAKQATKEYVAARFYKLAVLTVGSKIGAREYIAALYRREVHSDTLFSYLLYKNKAENTAESAALEIITKEIVNAEKLKAAAAKEAWIEALLWMLVEFKPQLDSLSNAKSNSKVLDQYKGCLRAALFLLPQTPTYHTKGFLDSICAATPKTQEDWSQLIVDLNEAWKSIQSAVLPSLKQAVEDYIKDVKLVLKTLEPTRSVTKGTS
jgi:hypothetical protein